MWSTGRWAARCWRFMAETGFEAKRGEALAVPTGGQLGAKAAVLVGMGDPDTIDADAMRRAGAALARRASKVEKVATTLLDVAPDSLDRADAAQALAEGVALGAYQFLAYKSEAKPSRLARVQVLGRANAKVRDGLARGARIAEAVVWARDLVNEPAEAKSPETVVKLARALARANGLTVRVWAGEQLVRERLGGVHRCRRRAPIGRRASCASRTSRAAREATLALVGKGVVFDSGGLSLKTAGGMETMKTDMSGAAAVIAAMSALRDLDVKTRVLGYVPLVENMPSGNAMRPGDVLRMRNGKTVEVLNTDAEGRLILADALSLASEDKPDAIVDIATLTGAVTVALGDKIAGLMGTDDGWSAQVRERGRPRRRAHVAAAAARRLPQAARLRDRRPAQHRDRRGRRHAHRRTVPPRVRGRRAVGAPRRGRDRPGVGRRRLHLARAAPATASARSSSSPRTFARPPGSRRLGRVARPEPGSSRVDLPRPRSEVAMLCGRRSSFRVHCVPRRELLYATMFGRFGIISAAGRGRTVRRLAVAVGLVAGGLVAAARSRPAPAPVWSMHSSPEPERLDQHDADAAWRARPPRAASRSAGTASGVDHEAVDRALERERLGSMPSPNPGSATQLRTSAGSSCPSTKSCFAVGSYSGGRRSAHARRALERQRVGFVTAARTRAARPTPSLTGVSCPNLKSCFAVGSYSTVVDDQHAGRALERERAGGSRRAPTQPGGCSTNLRGDRRARAPKSCFAVGATATGSGDQGVGRALERQRAGESSPAANPSGSTAATLTRCACPSTKSCFAVGNYSHGIGRQDARRALERQQLVDSRRRVNPSSSTSLSGVACPNTKSCFAVGNARGQEPDRALEREQLGQHREPEPAGRRSTAAARRRARARGSASRSAPYTQSLRRRAWRCATASAARVERQ